MVGTNNDTARLRDVQLSLEQIAAPTLVLHGTADTNVPIEHGERLAERIPGARLVRFEGADHAMPITRAAEIEREVRAFLSGLSE